jgi:hypothetical protein
MPIGVSTRLVSEVITAVKRQFGDESGTQITDEDIIRWVNQGQESIAISENIMRQTATTPSVAGQSEYNMPSDQIIKIMAIYYDNAPLQNVTFDQAQQSFLSNNDFASIQAIPTTWYEWAGSIYLYPIPATSGLNIKLFITARPAVVTAGTDLITIPDVYYNSLLAYVLQQAYELDDNFSSAAVKAEQMKNTLSNLDPDASFKTYTVVTIMPEDA